MTIQDAYVRSRIAQRRAINVPEIRIDRRERGNRMPLTQREYVLAAARRIGDVEIQKSAVIEGD